MKIFVKVKANAKEEKLVAIDQKNYLASVKAAPQDGEANEALFRLLGKYFHVAPSTIRITYGEHARQKIVDVPLEKDSLDPLLDDDIL